MFSLLIKTLKPLNYLVAIRGSQKFQTLDFLTQ